LQINDLRARQQEVRLVLDPVEHPGPGALTDT
jgi:hypothetical protein